MDDLLIAALEQLDEDQVLKLVEQRLQEGQEPDYLQEQVQLGMVKVGILYEKGEYFIADLIMAGRIIKTVFDMILTQPGDQDSQKIGKILIGTVQGDLHDIGKNIFSSMVEAEKFEVIDLGIDVPPEEFVAKTREIHPQIIAMSGVLTLAVESMKQTVDALTTAGLRGRVKVLIGGNPINSTSFKYIGADAYGKEAAEGVQYCKNWIREK